MYFKWLKKVGAGVLALTLVFGTQTAIPVTAAADNIEIILTDVTQDDQTTLLGEAKIKVSVKGDISSANIIQASFTFSGDLEYSSTEYLLGEDNTSEGKIQQTTGASSANTAGAFTSTIISVNEALPLKSEIDAFIISFVGDPGEAVTLTVDKENTYVKSGDTKYYAANNVSEAATSSETAKEPLEAKVELVIDTVNGFNANAQRPVSVKITNEVTNKSLNVIVEDSNRISISPLTYLITQNVVKGDTYTVEVSANGYIPYVAENYDFEKTLTVDNSKFIPGDVNGDEKVDSEDKALYEQLIKDNMYNAKADFNCDGKTDDLDNVFAGIESDSEDNENNGDNGSTGGESSGDGGTTSSGSTGSGSTGGTSGGGSTGGGTGGGSGGSSSSGGGSTASTTPVAKEAFTDLSNYAWAKESIYTLKNKGIISGISETEYAPANNIKRGDFILILTRMLSITDEFTENFADVSADSYYYNAIGSAKAAGIASGDGQSFMPENTITRQDLITLAYRAFLAKGYITEAEDMTSLDDFADKDSISDYALAPMASMVKAGVIQGSDGNVNPLGNATRAEVAVMCARLLALMN